MAAAQLDRRPHRIGRYLVFSAFAHGGMASIHLGRLLDAPGISRIVAIKRMHPIYAGSEAHTRMLRDEARITSRIRHANVVTLLDVVHEGGELCLVMEYVRGVSLADLLREARERDEPMPLGIASSIVCDLLRGLHAAHEAKAEDGSALHIVHRDISPHNVLVGADGVARVLDFGVAKMRDKEHLTMSGELRGKLSYMAPEQLRGQSATRQTDLYSTGIVLWETLTGASWADELSEVGANASPASRPSERAGRVPRALDDVVLRALAADRRKRWETAEEMALALEEACAPAPRELVVDFLTRTAGAELARREELAREAESAPEISDVPVDATSVRPRAEPTAPIRGRRLVLLVGAVAVVITASALAMAPRPRAHPSPPVATMVSGGPSASASVSTPVAVETIATASTTMAASTARFEALPSVPSGQSRPGAVKPDPACVAPFTIDDAGVKRYRRECF